MRARGCGWKQSGQPTFKQWFKKPSGRGRCGGQIVVCRFVAGSFRDFLPVHAWQCEHFGTGVAIGVFFGGSVLVFGGAMVVAWIYVHFAI